MAVYSVNVTRQRTGSTLEIDEDILYGGVRVGGVNVTVTPEPGAKLGQLGQVVTGNIKTSTLLQQDVDVTYDSGAGAQVVGHLQVIAQPDPEIGHSVSVTTTWYQPIPFEVDATTLP